MTMISWWLSVALAGTVRVHSATPVSVKVDDRYIGRVVTEATVTDLAPGTHSIEVLDALGVVLATTDVVVTEGGEPLWFDYYAKRLLAVTHTPLPGDAEPIPDAAMQSLEVHLAKKRSDVKRMKYFDKYYAYWYYEMRHVDSLLLAFTSIEYRIQVCEKLAGRTLDPNNTGAIEDHFPQGEFRERAMATFAGYQTAEEE